jgi:hypothetical protein
VYLLHDDGSAHVVLQVVQAVQHNTGPAQHRASTNTGTKQSCSLLPCSPHLSSQSAGCPASELAGALLHPALRCGWCLWHQTTCVAAAAGGPCNQLLRAWPAALFQLLPANRSDPKQLFSCGCNICKHLGIYVTCSQARYQQGTRKMQQISVGAVDQ